MALRRFYVALRAWLHQRETEALAYIRQENRTPRGPCLLHDVFKRAATMLRDELPDREIFYTLTEGKILIKPWRRQYNTV